mmetsp:Transcript_131136/g.407875  ORF Transcript_131136/g.407875 Transcript_131136/m.407875 type:complete len:207 (-) Transcript_131136:173-793(-)
MGRRANSATSSALSCRGLEVSALRTRACRRTNSPPKTFLLPPVHAGLPDRVPVLAGCDMGAAAVIFQPRGGGPRHVRCADCQFGGASLSVMLVVLPPLMTFVVPVVLVSSSPWRVCMSAFGVFGVRSPACSLRVRSLCSGMSPSSGSTTGGFAGLMPISWTTSLRVRAFRSSNGTPMMHCTCNILQHGLRHVSKAMPRCTLYHFMH